MAKEPNFVLLLKGMLSSVYANIRLRLPQSGEIIYLEISPLLKHIQLICKGEKQ